MSKDRIAIIGIGCRFPGGINHPDALWKLLVEGCKAVHDVPPDTGYSSPLIAPLHRMSPRCNTPPAQVL
jgi:acyl transferase domain-containing protein